MLSALQRRLRREQFLPTHLSLVTSPIYFIRRGLFLAVRDLAPRITGDVLDFGCGSKPYETLFTGARTYIGVDIEQSGHNHKTSKVDFFYDGKHLPFADHSFDSVVAFEVFEHVFNIDVILPEVARVLKPGGSILITVPFAWDEHEVPYDFARYTSYGIRHIFEKAGFDILITRKTTTYFVAVGQLLIAYLAQHVAPRNRVLAKTFQVLLLFPLNLLIAALNHLLPRRDQYFCNTVLLARKHPAP